MSETHDLPEYHDGSGTFEIALRDTLITGGPTDLRV